jgi:hypothetical protein
VNISDEAAANAHRDSEDIVAVIKRIRSEGANVRLPYETRIELARDFMIWIPEGGRSA